MMLQPLKLSPANAQSVPKRKRSIPDCHQHKFASLVGWAGRDDLGDHNSTVQPVTLIFFPTAFFALPRVQAPTLARFY